MAVLDIRSIIFTSLITDIICTFVIVILWRQNRRRYDGIGFWAGDYFLQTTSLLLIILRGIFPDWMSYVLSNTLVVAAALLMYAGLARFMKKQIPQVHNYVILIIFPLIHTYLTFISPTLSGRNLLISIVLFIICFQCFMLIMFRIEPSMRILAKWIGTVFIGYCLVFIYRIAAFIIHPYINNDYFHSGLSEALVLISYQVLSVLLTYFLVLMVNRRLLMEIQLQEEKYSKSFHAAPYGIILTRLSDGKVYEVNDGFLKMTGYSLMEFIGQTTLDLHIWSETADRALVVDELTKKGEIYGKEVKYKKKSGEIMTGLFSAVTLSINNEKFILSTFNDITDRKRGEEERERLIVEREKALAEIKTLSGLLPICASCKKIRDDSGYWNQIESYISSRSQAEFTHGICPDCMEKYYPGLMKRVKKELNENS